MRALAAGPIFALTRDHHHVKSPMCGDLVEILTDGGSAPDVAVLVDVTSTQPHYHRTFDEVYFVLDGALNLRLFNPHTDRVTEHVLREHELCVIPRGVHHEITSASIRNRLCVLTMPGYNKDDQIPSDVMSSVRG
jgi:mannose-6-phosphate isomerase-like protein (cupin superfamily)